MKPIFSPTKTNTISNTIPNINALVNEIISSPSTVNINTINNISTDVINDPSSNLPEVITVKRKIDIAPIEVKKKLENIFNTVESSIQIALDEFELNPGAMGTARGLADLIKAVQSLLQAINDVDDPRDKYIEIVTTILITTQKNFMKALSDKIYKADKEINIALPQHSELIKPIFEQILLDVSKQVKIDFDLALPKLQTILDINFKK